MKKLLKLFIVMVAMISGLALSAQDQCNNTKSALPGNDAAGTQFPVSLACATDACDALGGTLTITDINVNSLVIHYSSPTGTTTWCPSWYDLNVFVNGVQVMNDVCGAAVAAYNFSVHAPITSLVFQIEDNDGWSDNVYIDYNIDVVYDCAVAPPQGGSTCQLVCPGDMLITLDAGECCWAAQYDARTLGCDPNWDTILTAPPVINGFTGPFDINTYPEWDPNVQSLPNWTTPWVLNGPGSVAIGAGLGISGISSAITMNTVPTSIRLYGRDRFDAGDCPGPGTGALWNYTMVNFVAPFTGTLKFNWSYTSGDISPYWDPFGYMDNAWVWNVITNNAGPLTQNGVFTRHMNAGQSITFFVVTDDYPCSANVLMNNFSFAGDPIKNGIVHVSGPKPGDLICDGETKRVRLNLLKNTKVIDSCEFDITVQDYQNPTTTLACNDNVQIAVDNNCVGLVTPDMILEGGPYSCYDNYDVKIFTGMPANPAGAQGNVSNPVPLGNYVVGVYDENGNNCWGTISVVDKIPPTIDCVCPVGGEFPAGSVIPGNIAGAFTTNDKVANLRKDCWDFGTENIVPDLGNHYYDVYAITTNTAGDYSFAGSDGNKMILGVFNKPFNAVNSCDGMVGGAGGYVAGLSGAFYEEPITGGGIINTVSLLANKTYYVVVSDFDAEHTGGYSFNITGPQGAVIKFAKTVWGAECEFAGCYEAGVAYEFPLPDYDDNCSGAKLTWTQTVVDGPDCGTYIVRRHYTVTDGSGWTAKCSSEYFFKGIDLATMVWPLNHDGLPENKPMLECNSGYEVDWRGNPDPSVTGAPAGFNDACGTIEVFYNDQVYQLPCGIKILREWTVVDDCTGGVYQHIQVIRITDKTKPTFCQPSNVSGRTKAYICEADIEVPAINCLEDNCDANPRWWVTTTAGLLAGDTNKNGFVDANEKWYIIGATIGEYTLCYHAIDNCGNQETKCVTVTVIDGVPPIPVCEQYKQVSLTGYGHAKVYADSYDSGSFDNCNPVWFKVLRVNDQLEYDGGCPTLNGDDNPKTPTTNDVWYDDEVYFCCEDVGKEVMVSMRVFDVNPGVGPVNPSRMLPGGDLYGHYNDCWNITYIECKIPPVLTCPPITINCEESLDPNDNPKLWPGVVSLCGVDLTYTDSRDNSTCGANITRTWTAKGCEKTTTCKQTIKVEGTTPFDPCTIVFPSDKQTHCTNNLPDGGKPTWDEFPCNVITTEIIKEDTFKFVEGACYKILREWAVIDWCVYKPNTGAEWNVDAVTSARKLDCNKLVRDGYYRYTQVLKVVDLIPPKITVEDKCVATTDCYAYNVEMKATASDTCNTNEEYWWKYKVENLDCVCEPIQVSYNYTPKPATAVVGKRSLDKLDKVKEAKLVLLNPAIAGNYKVTWTVGDGCGNATTKEQFFTIADKKAPTPLMVDIATAVMENGMVELKARWFDKGGCGDGCISSFDNCTAKDELYFTFTPMIPNLWVEPVKWANQFAQYGRNFFDPTTGAISTEAKYLAGTAHAWYPQSRSSSRVWLCDYVAESNYYKTIQVYVWDQFALNEDCDDNNYDFANVIVNFNHCGSEPKPMVAGTVGIENMTMKATYDEGFFTTNTKNGAYEMAVNANESYKVSGTKDTDFLNGVTTLDLVIIQKYLLGLKSITDAKLLLAADINNNGDITAADLLEARKVILGTKDRFTNNSWIAVDPTTNKREREITVGTANVSGINFDPVKIGDMNKTANALESRSSNSVRLMTDDANVKVGQIVEIPFYAEDFAGVYGAQFTMNLSGMTLEEVVSGAIALEGSNYNVVNDNLIVSFNEANGIDATEGAVLFTLKVRSNVEGQLSDVLNISDEVLRSEIYTGKDLEISNIEIGYRNSEVNYALYQNEPNPFVGKTTIGFDLPAASNYTLTIFDGNGKELKVVNSKGVAGYNTVTIDDLNTTGVFTYRLKSDDFVSTRKMVSIK